LAVLEPVRRRHPRVVQDHHVRGQERGVIAVGDGDDGEEEEDEGEGVHVNAECRMQNAKSILHFAFCILHFTMRSCRSSTLSSRTTPPSIRPPATSSSTVSASR